MYISFVFQLALVILKCVFRKVVVHDCYFEKVVCTLQRADLIKWHISRRPHSAPTYFISKRCARAMSSLFGVLTVHNFVLVC